MPPPNAHSTQSKKRRSLQSTPEWPDGRDERRLRGAARRAPLGARAAIAASIVALAAAGPAVALATEPGSENTAPLGQPGDPDSATDPDFDPGGEQTHLPTVPAPAPAAPAPAAPAPAAPGPDSDDPTLGDPEPTGDVPVVDQGDNDDLTAPARPAPEPAAPPVGAAAPPAASAPPTPAPAQPAPTTAPQPAASATPVAPLPLAHGLRGRHTLILERARVRRVAPRAVSTPTPSGATDVTPTPAPAVIPGDSATAHSTSASGDGRVRPAGSVHVVRAGESLWSIAGDLLGSDASPVRVAREVGHLWQRNRERIATGNPDVLRIGTTLRLR